jgi:hypothetical protein
MGQGSKLEVARRYASPWVFITTVYCGFGSQIYAATDVDNFPTFRQSLQLKELSRLMKYFIRSKHPDIPYVVFRVNGFGKAFLAALFLISH